MTFNDSALQIELQSSVAGLSFIPILGSSTTMCRVLTHLSLYTSAYTAPHQQHGLAIAREQCQCFKENNDKIATPSKATATPNCVALCWLRIMQAVYVGHFIRPSILVFNGWSLEGKRLGSLFYTTEKNRAICFLEVSNPH